MMGLPGLLEHPNSPTIAGVCKFIVCNEVRQGAPLKAHFNVISRRHGPTRRAR